MNGHEKEEGVVFEIAVAVPKWGEIQGDESGVADCVDVLVDEFKKKGLIVERVLAAPLEILGKVAAELKFRKRTHIGIDLPFEWDEVEAFVRQPDGSLFSWCERFYCYNHILDGIVNTGKLVVGLKSDGAELYWQRGESLVEKLKSLGVIKDIFPLHDERKRKLLLRSWALNYLNLTTQPVDEICSYYGMKIATYFAFLGMYTKWMLFPAALGLMVHFVDFGSLQLWVLPLFFTWVIAWAILFFQFWKRKSSALLARWQVYHSTVTESEFRFVHLEPSSPQNPKEIMKKQEAIKMKEKAFFQKEEWIRWLMRFRNDAFIITSIICLQLPFELAYAHLYEVIDSDFLKFCLTAGYLFSIQYFTRLGGKISVKLVKHENNENVEYRANSLVYKVFGLYFMQTYIGIFYHALLHRNIMTLRQVLIQRLILYELIENVLENSFPFLSYTFKKFRTVRNKRKCGKGPPTENIRTIPRVEKDYLKPAYAASISQELEDGLFDDFLELVLQFGMTMMFACAFPLAFAFAAVNNIAEIRTDALKLLTMMRRPIPRSDATIGAWLNIFQFLIVASICTNSILLVCLYDQEGTWNLSPGLAAILVMEHVLLFAKFGFSRIVPEEPAWVRADRKKNAAQVEQICSRQLLRTISGDEKLFWEMKKNE
ncbi:anoctamin-like protein-like [Dorcoceras hygrometricum]|uniref:Anoctamin-like protein-like n=1 Tax=Dorcoceras hygrometricum TaxID=472368 RepID=A0A2Z7BCS3_9LAMI|nr:anoctamin-like protein-like [Dorcoceras hygrometricum]